MTWIDSLERRAVMGPLALSLAVAAGCSVDDASGYMDDQPPNGVCETDGDDPDCMTTGDASSSTTTDGTSGGPATTGANTGTTSGGGVDGDACQSSAECPDGELCVADFIDDQRGPYQCVGMCLEEMDEAKWCADAAACCNAGATCTDRGFCVGGSGGSGDTGTSG